jgi:poly(3-hydroxybutyrate) depolymerase
MVDKVGESMTGKQGPWVLARVGIALLFGLFHNLEVAAERLKTGRYSIEQSWTQEQNYQRFFFVHVPAEADEQRLPVLIFLHGNGGNGSGAMRGFHRRYPKLSSRYVTVFPDGYSKSWNIVSERSKANDREFIEAIIQKLAGMQNVVSDQFTIMGASNGAALANQLAIESSLPQIKNYVTCVSPLNVFQHDGKNFKARGMNNQYTESVTPRNGIRLLNVSGDQDPLVPYQGGESRGIPAPGGRLSFVAAEDSILLWARALGYRGEKLAPTSTSDGTEKTVYLHGDVVHYKILGEGHGASRSLSESMLLQFLEPDPNK